MQTVPAAIHSGRIPPPRPTSHGDGRLRQPHPLTTPDMVRSGRVLPTSVKSPIYCTVNQMTLVHMVFSREVFSCAFCTKLPSYTEALRACLSRLKKRPGRLFSHLPGLLFLLKAVTCARSVQVIVEWQGKVREACFSLLWNKNATVQSS